MGHGMWLLISRLRRRRGMKFAGLNPMKVFFKKKNPMKLKLKKKMKNKKKVECIIPSSHVPSIAIGGGGGGSSSFGVALIGGDLLVCDILTRLSVKSLSRFKSVCKRWCSLIQQDQNFIDLHLTRSQTRPFPPCRLYIVVTGPKTKEEEDANIDTWPYKKFHITADLLFEEDNKGHDRAKLEVDTVRQISYSYTIISKPVNGLICLLDSTINNSVTFRICNTSTGEISRPIESTFLEEKEYVIGTTPPNRCILSPYYGFGFNPATNEHKLVCVWEWHEVSNLIVPKLGKSPNNIICEVLTIGHHHQDGSNNRWRRIAEVPPYKLTEDKSVYVNGVIYWSTLDLRSWGWGFYDDPAHIVAFDMGSEKFRAITISNTIPYQVPERVNHYNGYVDLLQVDGHLAILIGSERRMFRMYIYKGDYKEEEEDISRTFSTSSCKNSKSWSEVSTGKLPLCHKNYLVKFDSLAGSNDMIILTLRHKNYCDGEVKNKKKKCFSIYCYNWKNGVWTELDVSGFPSSVPHLCTSTFFASSFETLFSPSQIPQIISTPTGGSAMPQMYPV